MRVVIEVATSLDVFRMGGGAKARANVSFKVARRRVASTGVRRSIKGR